ncbi:hypothetical protein D3C75_490000 [compost metagenome]
MKISYFIGFTIAVFWWLFTILLQLLVPLTFYLGFAEHPGFLALCAGIAMCAALATGFCGGLNTVPALIWRFRKEVNTRIIELEGKYAVQMKVLGGWIYVDASDRDCGFVGTAWDPEFSARKFILKRKSDAEDYLVNLGKYLADGRKESAPMAEVLSNQSFINGTRVKNN